MGAGSSSTGKTSSSEEREVESLVASTGALPVLQSTFSTLKDPATNAIPLQSLQQCFYLDYKNLENEGSNIPESFPMLLDCLGTSIVELFFVTETDGGVCWIEFLRGYLKCCGRMPASSALNLLFKLLSLAYGKAGLSIKLEFQSLDDDVNDEKITGCVLASDVVMLLWMCWTMSWDYKTLRCSKEKGYLCLPDVNHVVLSAVFSCVEDDGGFDLWACDVSSLDVQIPVGKFVTWALATVPCLTDCFTQFVNARLHNPTSVEEKPEPSTSSLGEVPRKEVKNSYLLTSGIAWAVSLTLRGTPSSKILKPYLPGDDNGECENLLYRSSLHGRGLNRFWSNVDGYHGPSLLLVFASSKEALEVNPTERKWIIGALTMQGFENKDQFYGSSGSLYAISPVFHAYSASGKDKNFVYSHLHAIGKAYEPHPKPVGIAFGGTLGNERIFIDKDFSKITVRHHAADKTYKHGSLFPSQGFLPVEAIILEVEVWGLGGKTAKEIQNSYQKREELFTEQRRKVDLKTFASWEDSPEKIMMDMMGNPNAVHREER